jgi:hypothetical protein
MSVPALLVGAGVVGAVWWGSRSPKGAAGQTGGTQPGAGNTNANQGDTYASAPMPQISEPPVGVVTPTEASTGIDVGVQTYQQAASPWDPSKVQTVTVGGGLSQPSSSGSPSGPADGGLSTGSLPVNDVIAAGQSQPQTFSVGAITLVDTVMGASAGTTRQDQGRTFSTWGPHFGAIW